GRTKEMREALERALLVDPLDVKTRFDLARSYESDRPDRAIALLRSVVERKPPDPDALLALGRLERREGRINDAIKAFDEIVRGGHANADVYLELVLAHEAGGRKSDALAIAERGARAFPDAIPMVRKFAELSSRSGDDGAAARAFERVVE